MEIEGEDGSKTRLKPGVKAEFGRGKGFPANDRTVSRRHVSFLLHNSTGKDETKVHFEALGKNPLWVFNSRTGEIGAFRRSESGEVCSGDAFCVSARNPLLFVLKKVEFESEGSKEMNQELGFANELAESLEISSGSRFVEEIEGDSIDISTIEPVKEFGFLVMGHEFDRYPAKVIHDVKNWDWFIEEPDEDSEDDEVRERKGKNVIRKKRKKSEGYGDEDDEWTGESEEDSKLISNTGKIQRPNYLTRSKDHDTSTKVKRMTKDGRKKSFSPKADYSEDEDENDDTLGGFIVDDDDVEQGDEEEEEEDYDGED